MFSEPSVRALILSAIAGSATLVGALVIFFAKTKNERLLSISLGFAAGIMLSVSFTDLFPTAQTLLSGTLSDKQAEMPPSLTKAFTVSIKEGETWREIFAENGNYAFIKTKQPPAVVKERLEEKKILIKTYGQEMLKDYVRISTGSKQVMERFANALLEADR